MQRVAIIFLLLFSGPAIGQIMYNGRVIKSPADADAAEPLARILTQKCTTDRQKVTAIFNWITQNISYQVRPRSGRNIYSAKFEVEDMSDTATVLKPLDERIADLVVRRREAFCDGYSRLFKTLCSFSGVTSEVITGYSRTNADNGKFRSNHTWNAVMIDSQWHLLDVTWASGFITFSSNEYIRRYNDYYFLTEPSLFINDHYPEDVAWTLLPDPPYYREYKASPFKQQGYIRNKITSFVPERGIIEAKAGDTVYFELQTDYRKAETTLRVDTADVFDEENIFRSSLHPTVVCQSLSPTNVSTGRLFYRYVVVPGVQYLNLTFNGHAMLQYRVNLKKEPESFALSKPVQK